MREPITEKQLQKIVAEVEELANRRNEELDRDQVKDILQELNLPPELLDDAMIQLQRREALVQENRRNRWLVGSIAGVLVVAIALGSFFITNRQQTLDAVTANQSRLTLSQDDGNSLTTFNRNTTPEISYRVTLQQAPLGERLGLRCDWIDPTGNIAHQNQYQTKPIDTPTWQTRCRYQLKASDLPGNWQVKIYLGDRVLSQNTFVVK